MADDIKFNDDLDNDLGGDMMDFDFEAQNDDRNPATIFAKSALSGVKTTMSDPGFIGDVVKDALPKGYRSALDVADNLTGEIRTVYSESAQALKPSIDEFKRNAQQHLPKIKKILPDSIGSRVEKILEVKREATSEAPTKQEVETAQINSDLDRMFQAQAASVEVQREQQTQDILQNTISEERQDARHTANMTANERMINAFNRLVSYQDNITSQFQRRLLELNYRQFFAQRDLVDISRAGFTDIVNALGAIVKNTALPDEAKVNLSETYADEARSRLAGQALDHVGSRIAGISQRVKSTLGQKVKQHVDNFKEGFNQGSTLLATASSMEGLDGFGPKQTGGQKAADLAGGLIGDGIANRIGAKVSDLAGRAIGRSDKATTISNKLQFNADNLPEILNRYASSQTDATGIRGGVESFLKDVIGGVRGTDGDVLHNLKQEALTATSFDIMTRRSIVEIIPGYLSRMLQQLEIFNSQDPNVERMEYSVEGEDFVRASENADRIREAVFSSTDRERLSSNTVDVINSIDPDNKLSAEAREVFAIQILTDLRNGKGFFPERYYQPSTFTMVDNDDAVEEIQSFVKDRYAITAEGKVGNVVTASQNALRDNQAVKNLQNYLPNLQESINQAVSVGDKDALRESGLINKAEDGVTDQIDSDALWSMIQGDISNTIDGREITTSTYDSKDTTQIQETLNESISNLSGDEQKRVREAVAEFTREVDVNDQSTPTMDVWTAIHNTLIQGNGLTTSLIARIDTWMNRDATLEEESTSQDVDPYIPYLTAIQERTVTSDDTLTDIKLIMSQMYEKIGTLGSGGGDQAPRGKMGMGGILGKGLDFGKSAVSGAASGLKSYYSGMFNLGGSALGMAKDTVLGGAKFIKGKLGDLPGDLYVAGQQIPTLLGERLRKGKYIDEATGKIIQSAKDITGAVRDIDTGEIVLSVEDYTKGLFNRDGVSKLADGAMSVLKAPVEFIQSYYKGLFGIGEYALKGVGNVKDTVENILNRHGDIYVRGEQSPRLLKILLEKGLYFSARTGEAIRSFKDIDGNVVDGEGNIVLSVEDIKKGLVDEQGRKIEVKSLLNRALEMGMGVLGKGIDVVKGGINRTGRFLFGSNDDGTPQGGLFSRIGGMFTSITDNLKAFFTNREGMRVNEVIIHSDLTSVYGPWTHGGDQPPPSGLGPDGPMSQADSPASTETKASKDVKDKHLYTLMERTQQKTDVLTKQVLSSVRDVTGGLETQIRESDSTLNQNLSSLVESSKDAYTVVSDKATDASMQVKDSIESLKETIISTFKKEKVLGDADGDGIRDGSYLDQRNKESLADKAKAAVAKSAPGAAVLGGVAGFLGGLTDKIKGLNLFGGEDDEGGFFGDVAGEAASEIAGDALGDQFDRDSRADRKERRAQRKAARASSGKRGIFSKIKSLGGKGLSAVGNFIKSPGKALLAAGSGLAGMVGTGASTLAGMGSKVASVAGKGASMLGGAGKALGTLGRVGLAVGRVALGPVGWAATALWGAYKGAQYLNSRSDADPIEDMRFKQMGINTEEGSQLRAIRLLEEASLDNITFNDKGEATLPKVDYNDLIDEHGERFNVDKNNPQNLEAFVRWYEGTFKPTLLTYATLANRIDEDLDVDDLDDDLPEDQLVPFTKKAFELLESSPAIGNTSPYFDQEVTSDDVVTQYNRVMQEYGGELKDTVEATKDSPEPVTSGLVPPASYTPPRDKEMVMPETVIEEPQDALTRKLKAAAIVSGGSALALGTGSSSQTSTLRPSRPNNAVALGGLGLTMGGVMAANADTFDPATRSNVIPFKDDQYTVNLDEVIDQQRLRNQNAVLAEEQRERVVLDDHISAVNQYSDKRVNAVDAHQQMHAELANEQLGYIGNILNESLYVQQSMDDTLKRIWKHLQGDEVIPKSEAPTSGGESAAERAKQRQAEARRRQLLNQRQRSTPPVGMGKTG